MVIHKFNGPITSIFFLFRMLRIYLLKKKIHADIYFSIISLRNIKVRLNLFFKIQFPSVSLSYFFNIIIYVQGFPQKIRLNFIDKLLITDRTLDVVLSQFRVYHSQ